MGAPGPARHQQHHRLCPRVRVRGAGEHGGDDHASLLLGLPPPHPLPAAAPADRAGIQETYELYSEQMKNA